MGIKTQFSLTSDTLNQSTKFNLYLKTHEVKQINSVLKNIMMMQRDQREEWILENGELVQSAFDTFIDDSNVVLENLNLDDETIELSQELVVSLRDTMQTVESILTDEYLLDS